MRAVPDPLPHGSVEGTVGAGVGVFLAERVAGARPVLQVSEAISPTLF